MSTIHSLTLDADQIQTTHPPLVYATFLRRLAAWLIDLIVLAVIGFVIGIITSFLLPWRIDNTAGYLIMLIYNVTMHHHDHATIGKTLMDMRVEPTSGGALTLVQCIRREAFLIPFLVFFAWHELTPPTISVESFQGINGSGYSQTFSITAEALLYILLVLASLADVLWILVDDRKRALHDRVAGTVCVRG